MKEYWIVDQCGNDIRVQDETGSDRRTYRVSNDDPTCALQLSWDPGENAYEVTGEFTVHQQKFSDTIPDDPGM